MRSISLIVAKDLVVVLMRDQRWTFISAFTRAHDCAHFFADLRRNGLVSKSWRKKKTRPLGQRFKVVGLPFLHYGASLLVGAGDSSRQQRSKGLHRSMEA